MSMDIFKRLKKQLENNEINKAAETLIQIHDKYKEKWLTSIKLNGVFPEPISHKFSSRILGYLLKTLQKMWTDRPDINFQEEVVELIHSILVLHLKIEQINQHLNASEFFMFDPVKQMQMLFVFIEDQSRLGQAILLKSFEKKGKFTGIDLIKSSFDNPLTGDSVSIVDNHENLVDAVDLILRYIYWKHEKVDGEHHDNVSPYNLKQFRLLLELAVIRNAIDIIWQNTKYREWKCIARDKSFYFMPCDSDAFVKENAAVDRYRLYVNELSSQARYGELSDSINLFSKIISEIKVNISAAPWDLDVNVSQLQELLSLPMPRDIVTEKLFDEFYKENIADLLFGPPSMHVRGGDLLLATKYLYILASIYQNNSWPVADQKDAKAYDVLIPTIKIKTLIDLLSKACNWPEARCENALELLFFNVNYAKLDLSLQPLTRIGNGYCLLIPIISLSINIVRLFESHMLQWNISLKDRGKLFEKEVRDRIADLNIPVISSSICFKASDNKDVEYDVIAWFKNYLVLIEAKCLCTPYSPIDS